MPVSSTKSDNSLTLNARRRWNGIFAAFGLAISAAAILLAYSLYPQRARIPQDNSVERAVAGYRAGGSACDPSKWTHLTLQDGARVSDACTAAEEQERRAQNSYVQARRSADAAVSQAITASDQARIAAVESGLALFTMVGAVLAAIFAGIAAFHTKESAGAAKLALQETRRMNTAIVRPNVAIEAALISFDETTHEPTIVIATRNASNFTAQDWEWQPQLKYGAGITADERKSVLMPWFTRGVRGINLPPGDEGKRMSLNTSFALNDAEVAAITSLTLDDGLRISLTVFTRCYDIFGNSVDDKHHFTVLAHNLFAMLQIGQNQYFLQRVPPGTEVADEEEEVPDAPNS